MSARRRSTLARLFGRGPGAAADAGSPEDLGRVLHHPDPAQLYFQLGEVVTKRTYLRRGVDVRPGDLVLDVGANVGVAAAFFASHCGAGTVHSFEPVAPLFELLAENVSRYPACVAHPYGLARVEGKVTATYYPHAAAMSSIHADPDRDRDRVRAYMVNVGVTPKEAERRLEGLHESRSVKCEVRRLSSVMSELEIEVVDLLKIDVEGSEHEVLAGLEEDDWPRIRQLAVEVHDLGGRLARIRDEAEARGFDVATEQEPEWRGTEMHMLYGVRQ